QFCDEGLADRLCAIVREAGVSPCQFELEVTEGVVLDQNETVRGALRRLRAEGFRVALDDFGTGYSSLRYLRDFEVDKIKIDKSFIQSLGHTMDAGAIVTAVVTLGRAMGLQVTAEGVETADQESFLRSAGCSQLQGFLFSRAVPMSELRRSMARQWRGLERAACGLRVDRPAPVSGEERVGLAERPGTEESRVRRQRARMRRGQHEMRRSRPELGHARGLVAGMAAPQDEHARLGAPGDRRHGGVGDRVPPLARMA